MLSKPNVNELIKKAGNRYQVALAIAKRARNIAQRRLDRGDSNIKDTVDLAATEIYEEKALVKIDGEYVLKNKEDELDIDTVISNTVNGILKDLEVKDELLDLEKPKKVKRAKKENLEKQEKTVTEIVDEVKSKTATKVTKLAKKKVTKDE